MVIRSPVVAVHGRLTRLVLLAAVLVGLTIGSWQVDGQPQTAASSASQEENSGFLHLQLMHESVMTLASTLVDIYPADCESVPVSCETCSQDECLPLTGIKSCAKVKFNARCNSSYPVCSSNSSIRVMAEQSATGFPRADGSEHPDDPQAKSICGTVRLDPIFKAEYEKNPYYAEYYVGFPDGSRRTFPGKEEGDHATLYPCKSYDSRLRPWYTAAISNRNHLVILVDSRRAETLDATYTDYWSDTLDFAKGLAEKLLGTVADQDRVNIVPFTSRAKAAALLSDSMVVKLNVSDPQTHEELEPLKQKLNELRAAPDEVRVSSSNLTAGLQEALGLFGNASGMLSKNVIVFTNGDISYDEKLNKTLDQLYDNFVRLFIFSMKNSDDKRRALDAVAERAHGAHVLLPPPNSASYLHQMRSYFGYMAEMQSRSDRTWPFWSPVYRDYYDVGDMYTVAIPAFSKSEPKTFIGVAAVDVLFNELGDILKDFQIALFDRPLNGGSEAAYQSTFQSMTVYNDNVMKSCDMKGKEEAFCKLQEEVDPNQNFLERFCCSECSEGSESLKTLRIALSTAIPGFLFLVTLSIAIYWCWRNRQSEVTVAAIEGDSGVQDEKLDSGTPTGSRLSDGLGLGSPRTKKNLKLAKLGGQRPTTDNSSGTPIAIRNSAMRLGVDKFKPA